MVGRGVKLDKLHQPHRGDGAADPGRADDSEPGRADLSDPGRADPGRAGFPRGQAGQDRLAGMKRARAQE